MLIDSLFWTAAVALVVTEPELITPAQQSFSNNSSDFKLISKFAAASYCYQIYENQSWACGRACVNATAGTVLVESSLDSITTSAGYPFDLSRYVAYNSQLKSIFISFRGTVTWQGVFVNANFYFSPADWKYKLQNIFPSIANDPLPPNLNIHAGFEAAYVRTRNRLMTASLKLAQQFPDYQIIFVGTSLGGALATLAAVDFNVRFGYGDRISLYTFGQPRVGDSNWARYVNGLPFSSRMYRISRRGDPVPHLPPMFLGYEHSLQMYSILDNGDYIKCGLEPGMGESLECLNDWSSLRPNKHEDYFDPGDKEDCQ